MFEHLLSEPISVPCTITRLVCRTVKFYPQKEVSRIMWINHAHIDGTTAVPYFRGDSVAKALDNPCHIFFNRRLELRWFKSWRFQRLWTFFSIFKIIMQGNCAF